MPRRARTSKGCRSARAAACSRATRFRSTASIRSRRVAPDQPRCRPGSPRAARDRVTRSMARVFMATVGGERGQRDVRGERRRDHHRARHPADRARRDHGRAAPCGGAFLKRTAAQGGSKLQPSCGRRSMPATTPGCLMSQASPSPARSTRPVPATRPAGGESSPVVLPARPTSCHARRRSSPRWLPRHTGARYGTRD